MLASPKVGLTEESLHVFQARAHGGAMPTNLFYVTDEIAPRTAPAPAARRRIMGELATEPDGAKIYTATSFDERHPPSTIIDGDDTTFWTTTGSYPQEFVLKLGSVSNIQSIKSWTTGVRYMSVERCEASQPSNWDPVCEIDVDDTAGQMQMIAKPVDNPDRTRAQFLKFRITSGWDDYSTVHKISIQGRFVR